MVRTASSSSSCAYGPFRVPTHISFGLVFRSTKYFTFWLVLDPSLFLPRTVENHNSNGGEPQLGRHERTKHDGRNHANRGGTTEGAWKNEANGRREKRRGLKRWKENGRGGERRGCRGVPATGRRLRTCSTATRRDSIASVERVGNVWKRT